MNKLKKIDQTLYISNQIISEYASLSRDLMNKVEDVLSGTGPLGLLPVLIPNPKIGNLPILRDLNGMQKSKDCIDGMDNLILPNIEKHLKTFDPNDMRDFMDVYLAAVKACKDPKVFLDIYVIGIYHTYTFSSPSFMEKLA